MERVAAIFAIGVAILSVLAQSRRGRLPTQLSSAGLAYEAEAAADTWAAVEDLQAQADGLYERLNRLGSRVLGAPGDEEQSGAMASTPANPDRDAELREFLRALRERNVKHRENVLRHAANLRRIADELRARGR